MSDPRRLLSDGASDFERDILRSWEAEQPSDAARAKVLAAAGLGVAVTVAATATKMGVAAGGSIAPKAAVSASAAVFAKWLVVGVVGVAVAGAAAGYAQHVARKHEDEARARAAAAAAAAAVRASAPEISPPPVVAPAMDGPIEVAPAAPAAPAAPRSRARPVTPREHPSALGEQVSALDSARRALASGDSASAIRQLDDYEARFPDGALGDEAAVLRVEALVAGGDRAGATRVAQRFLAARPNSPHAARVRALIAP